MASTRLTNEMRKSFVQDVLAGIPIKNKYNKDEAKMEIRQHIESALPKAIQDFISIYPNLVKREKHIDLEGLEYKYTDRWGARRTAYVNVYVVDHESIQKPNIKKWIDRKNAHDKEMDERKNLEIRLMDIASSCTTLAKLKDALPELESYMPKEKESVKALPISTGGLVTDMIKKGLKVPKGK